ncbi:MAG TPA: efflux RND transporter periplasmic adaptor subunit [Acidimicrobiales bacterium]|jgi:RND family efflux transporter MFP subunit
MPDSGSSGTATKPLDITQELALSDEDVFAAAPKPWWKRRTPLIVAAVVVAGGGVGLGLWLTGGSTPTGLTITNETVSVTTGTITQEVGASGTIAPASQASLNFAVSGTVTAVNVKAGQTVTAGETLATLSTSALQSEVDAAQAQLTSAQDRLSSDQSSSASTSQIDSDEASVTSAESSLSSAQTNLGDASLTSTIAGTVASVDLTVGQAVSGGGGGAAAASDSSSGSSAQVTVIGTTSYLVTTTVDDTQVGEIADGDQVTITPSGSTSTAPIFGTVASIGYIASQSSNVASFPVTIDVTGSPSGLYDGATANVEIIYKQLNNVTEIPTAAITYDTSGDAQVTEVVGGRHVTKNVTVGDAENGETQITSGLSPGDKVIQRVITFRPGSGTTTGGLLGGGGATPGGGRFNFPGGGGGGGGFPTGGTKNFVGGGG